MASTSHLSINILGTLARCSFCRAIARVESDSLPHAHAHSTKTFYKHQDSRIMKAQELKTKTSANSDINDNSSEIKLRGRLLESFQDDAKYEHVGQDTRSQGTNSRFSQWQSYKTATVRTIANGEQEINATVDGKEFTFTEASVRRHLQLAYADGISALPNTKIFDQLSLMGYVLTDDKLTFQKGKFSLQWRFLIHTILHCLSPKKTSWEQFSSNIATAIICLATNRTFNFSKLVFDGMVKNLDSKYNFLMYPRFLQIFLNKNKRLLNPHNRKYIAPTLTPKLFSNMKRGFSGEHTPLFPSMLEIQAEEGEHLGHPSEP
ncbi:hypothetical protein Tco_0804372 [Tanacetum coccineum]|uniref:Uncharacterized protein n=1 Tax=Tanacetum coccineum TaxID=301880 RepID=A0ABQ5A454_9ASTR